MVWPWDFVSFQLGEKALDLPYSREGCRINLVHLYLVILGVLSVPLLQLRPATGHTGFYCGKLGHPHLLLFIKCGCKAAIFLLQHGKWPWSWCLATFLPA